MAATNGGMGTREQPAQVALLPAPLPAVPAALLTAARQDATMAVAPCSLAQDASPAQDATVAVAPYILSQDATPAQDATGAAQADSAWRIERPPDQQPAQLPPLPGLLNVCLV